MQRATPAGREIDADAERLEDVGAADACRTARGCRAWRPRTPAPATTSATAVETLNSPAPSPPVPQVSTTGHATGTRSMRARMRARRPDQLVDRLALHAQRGEQAADLRRRRRAVHDAVDDRLHRRARRDPPATAAAWRREEARRGVGSRRLSRRRRTRRLSAPAGRRGSFASSCLPFERQDRLRMELHALERARSGGGRP